MIALPVFMSAIPFKLEKVVQIRLCAANFNEQKCRIFKNLSQNSSVQQFSDYLFSLN